MASPHFSYSSFSFLAIYSMSPWSCANNIWPSAKLGEYTHVFWIGIPIGWHFLCQFLNTHSRYILNRVGDKLQPCLNPLVTLKPFIIGFPIFIFEQASSSSITKKQEMLKTKQQAPEIKSSTLYEILKSAHHIKYVSP